MEVKHWSRQCWVMLFSIALTYPENPTNDDQHNYKRYFIDLMYVLPCEDCKNNYRRHMKELPINPFLRGGSQALFTWVLKMHNMINRMLSKPEITAAQAMGKYFPNMTVAEANRMGQQITYCRPQGGGSQTRASTNGDVDLKFLGLVLLGGIGLWYFTKKD